MTIDLIIPTYKPDKDFIELVGKMHSQTVGINRLVITNTEQKYFDRLLFDSSFKTDYKDADIRHISKKEFDHGRTRNESVRRSDADYFILMTQDAMPVDDKLIENLLNAFKKDPMIAVAYARQIARSDSNEAEKFTRRFNYPDTSMVKSEEDVETMGIKAYFCSNVCAMYRRDIFEELGGFLNHTIFNEDMLYAAKAMKSGYKIAYVAEAEVVHSHNYTNKQQYKRYFDNGVSQAKHPEIFSGLEVNGEGKKLVKLTAEHLKTVGKRMEIIPLYIQSAYKYLGFRKGKHYKSLSKKTILKCTSNPEYWIKDELMKASSVIDARQGYGRSKAELEMLADTPVKKQK